MSEEAKGKFKYFVGINSLAEIATCKDRVCVLNILGNESRGVTPVSHAYSGGNVVFGTSPGRRGEVLETSSGPSRYTTTSAKASTTATSSTSAWCTCRPRRCATASSN